VVFPGFLRLIRVPAAPVDEQIRRATDDVDNSVTELIKCGLYTVSRVKINGEFSFGSGACFINASVIKGSGEIFGRSVKKGDHMIITAEGAKEVVMSGCMELIISNI